ncbi:MAG TPA: PKD domain-containing protein, partial [Bacteroidia bacterium]|nr:PKD domain-containing protein [Bacteroidia bacterium]
VTASDLNGCHYSDSVEVIFQPKPFVSLGNDIISCDTVVLKPNSTFPKVLWNTGSSKPEITVKTSGIYFITVTDQYGCSASDTISVLINQPPAIDLGGPYYFCSNVAINQTLLVTGMKNIIWSNGATTNSILVTTPGNYSVIATDVNGCTAKGQTTVSNYTAPLASFNTTKTCTGTTTEFKDQSSILAGSIQKWEWSFDDGSYSQDQSPLHFYQNAGSYTIKLLVKSDKGCVDSVSKAITIHDTPLADFTYATDCNSLLVKFTDRVTAADNIVYWNWNWGDGSPVSSLQNPSHLYAAGGSYLVTLIAKTTSGCSASIVKQIMVSKSFTAAFTAKNVCDGKYVELKNHSAYDPADSVTLKWDFGDGTAASSATPASHLYTGPGIYTVSLTIKANSGCQQTYLKKIIVNPNPKVDFTASNVSGCSPFNTDFKDLSTITPGKIVNWSWEMGNRNSTIKFPENVYTNKGTQPIYYNVKLTVISDSGCSSSVVKEKFITVYPAPDATFSLTPKITNLSNAIITFKNNSKGTDSALWDFGDQLTSSVFNTAPHEYKDTGTYLIKLKVYSTYGCVDSTYREVVIQPEFSFYIPNSFTPNGDEINDVFSGKGLFIKDYEMIIFDRWGNTVFKTTDITIPWNGSKNNKSEPACEDVYIYLINITDSNRKKHAYKGIVTLVR